MGAAEHDLNLDLLRRRLADQEVVILAHEVHDGLIELVTAVRIDVSKRCPDSAMTAISVVRRRCRSPCCPSVFHRSPTPIAAAIGSATM